MKDEAERKEASNKKEKKVKDHEHITAVLHQTTDSKGERFLKPAKKSAQTSPKRTAEE